MGVGRQEIGGSWVGLDSGVVDYSVEVVGNLRHILATTCHRLVKVGAQDRGMGVVGDGGSNDLVMRRTIEKY